MNTQHPFETIAAFYDRRVAEFGHHPRACDYGHPDSQRRKFLALSTALDHEGRSVLDIGCGFADYADHLATRYASFQYSGMDLSPAMIARARAIHPDLDLQVGNILDLENSQTPSHDIVSANGIFYLLGADADALMKRIVTAMFRRCREAVVFNTLSTWAETQEPGEFYSDPISTVAWCRELTPWVTLHHDYLLHDFTIVLRRERKGL